MIFFSVLIPIITAVFLYVFFKHKTVWWELFIPMVISVIFIVIFKYVAISFVSSDTEYWSDIVVQANYYEEWDEYIHKTCESCETDSKGDRKCHTYDCSYVDTHPQYWEIVTKTGWVMNIDNDEYNRLIRRFKCKPIFVDMDRDYYTNDGDSYKIIWDGSDDKLECVVRSHEYENRTQVSDGIYNFHDVSDKDIKKYKLQSYPSINKYHKQRHLLGASDKVAEHNLDIINAKFGPTRELKAFVIVFKDQPIDAGIAQEAYWGGGNKNEFVLTIGIDSNGHVTWCYPFSWTEDASNEINIRNFVYKYRQSRINLSEITEYMMVQLSDFNRKHFSDFDYLNVEPTNTQKIWSYILTFLINIGLSIWLIKNEFSND